MKKKNWIKNQIEPEEVWGREWKTDPLPLMPDGQINIEQIYNTSVLGSVGTAEEWRCRFKRLPQCKIMCRTIISGSHVETDIYPVFTNGTDVREAKKYVTKEAQKKLNHKNAQKQFVRLTNANFQKGDLLMTLSYADGYYPDLKQARKDITNYLTAIRRYRRKMGMSELKYLYVIEYVPEGENTKKVRLHHHVIMSKMDRDVAESKWKKGRREAKYADPDGDFGLEGIARYMSKLESDGYHRWAGSKNLKKPTVYKSVTKLSKRKMLKMVQNQEGIGQMMEDLYHDRFRFIDSKCYISDHHGGAYIYGRLKKKEVEIVGDKENALSRGDLKKVRLFLDADWTGSLKSGESCYSTVLEAELHGKPWTKELYGRIDGTTKNRAVMLQMIEALERFREPCIIEVHSCSSYLCGGWNQSRFIRWKEQGYPDVKNADLIDRMLVLAQEHEIVAVCEKTNEYSEAEKLQRKAKRKMMEVKTDER